MKNILLGDLEHSSENHISINNDFLKKNCENMIVQTFSPIPHRFHLVNKLSWTLIKKKDYMQNFEIVK